MNNVVLIGRLTRDPEVRYMPETTNAMCTFTLAVDRNLSRERRQEMESKGQPTADFIRIVTWGKTAELCGNYLSKGKMTAISGRIQTGSYMNQQGQRVYTTDVVADRVKFLEWGEPNRTQNQAGYNSPYSEPVNNVPNYGQGSQSSNEGGFDDGQDDFIPFDDDSKIPF